MLNHLKKTNCKHTITATALLILGILFTLIGCAQVYEKLGLSPEQTENQVQQDQAATQQILNQTRTTTTEIISTTLAGLGAIASTILARLLGTERKITTALITGIEESTDKTVKSTVQTKATNAGIENQLHKRVIALT